MKTLIFERLTLAKFRILYCCYILLFLLFSQMTFSQSGWNLQYSGTNVHLYAVSFANQSTGWATGWETQSGGKVLLTTNGGLNWNVHAIPTRYPWSLFFINSNLGWIVGGTGGSSPPVVKTTDGGLSWSSIYIEIGADLQSVYFINQETGWACGANQTIIKSTNGGINWTIQHGGIPPPSFDELYSIFFTDPNNGLCVGGYSSYRDTIFKTNTGGSNWVGQLSVNSNSLKSIFFINQTTGWIVGYNGTVLKTNNGGVNWYSQTVGNYYLCSIYFTDINNGWSVGGNNSGIIFKTENGGINWIVQFVNTTFLNSVFFIDQNTGWAVGNNGTILKTTNGGIPIGIISQKSINICNYSLFQNYPNPFTLRRK